MADSVDRVFVHALNTVKKIPKTGATRPPPADRMRLYGLYKQAMEGDVDGVMERPSPSPSFTAEDLKREQDKWDAWNSQRGLSRTEAKRRYIEALIETIHRFATTPSALELVAELEFVWNQIKGNSSSSGGSGSSPVRRFREARPLGEVEGPMKVLSPMSEEDRESVLREGEEDGEDEEDGEGGEYVKKGDKWSKKMERAIVRLSAEIAALREQITSGREWRLRRERSVGAWVGWAFWILVKHLAVDALILALVLIWLRRRKDRRLEDHVRGALRLAREYVRKVLPAR
ncbi:acyl-CoA binding protein [Coniochaeta ligniaria NRRL 30616]|uniref:Acyl-CoA binding protein n=1 Tax=Coniochaeta ligniaria NRRL 30616 TaxID=1408157 RepID=A0A1J7JCL4_9PEZI|nr:acyl-CoA binding protein [Coniochaeta ligniaria NRRL 30616]